MDDEIKITSGQISNEMRAKQAECKELDNEQYVLPPGAYLPEQISENEFFASTLPQHVRCPPMDREKSRPIQGGKTFCELYSLVAYSGTCVVGYDSEGRSSCYLSAARFE